MTSPILPLLIAALAISGCGRPADSALNPFGARGGTAPASLEPEGGYLRTSDARPGIPQLLAAEWQPLNEGRLLVVRGFGPLKGYHSAALVTARPQPAGRMAPDADGVLRLRFVALPPVAEPALAANPATDVITVARPLSFAQLNRIVAVEIAGAGGVLTLRR